MHSMLSVSNYGKLYVLVLEFAKKKPIYISVKPPKNNN